jgi:chorismate dehydratase
MNNNIKISCVSYLNSKPFIYGLENSTLLNSHEIELSLDMPKHCAQKLVNNNADIGLVPVACLPLIKNYSIISNYCIGAVGAVNSVNLYSNVELKYIDNILLDYQSLTSINLTKILCKEYWKIAPNFIDANTDFVSNITNTTAGVIIGDRTFSLQNKFKYVYDLADEWQKWTGLPFVFAVWVSNKKIEPKFMMEFENCLQFGVQNIKTVAQMYQGQFANYDILKYLNHYISYNFDDAKKQALHLFLTHLNNL